MCRSELPFVNQGMMAFSELSLSIWVTFLRLIRCAFEAASFRLMCCVIGRDIRDAIGGNFQDAVPCIGNEKIFLVAVLLVIDDVQRRVAKAPSSTVLPRTLVPSFRSVIGNGKLRSAGIGGEHVRLAGDIHGDEGANR